MFKEWLRRKAGEWFGWAELVESWSTEAQEWQKRYSDCLKELGAMTSKYEQLHPLYLDGARAVERAVQGAHQVHIQQEFVMMPNNSRTARFSLYQAVTDPQLEIKAQPAFSTAGKVKTEEVVLGEFRYGVNVVTDPADRVARLAHLNHSLAVAFARKASDQTYDRVMEYLGHRLPDLTKKVLY